LALAFVTACAIAIATPFAALAVTNSGSIGIRLTEVSADLANDPRAQLYVIDAVAPGQTISRTVEISNLGGGSKTIACYVSAAQIIDGAFLGDDGATPNELTSWISTSASSLSLAPKAKSNVEVTIRVPDDAVAGERYGVIWAEVRSGASDSGIIVVNRVGIRIYLSVGPGGAPASSFEIRSLSGVRDADGSPAVEARVANTGARALDISGQLTLANGPGALTAGPFAATLGTTLGIGQSEIVRIVLDKRIPAGPWDATLTLMSGLTKVSGSATISFPDSGKNPAVPVDNFPPWEIPALIGGSAVLVGGLVTLSLAQYRSKRLRRRHLKRH